MLPKMLFPQPYAVEVSQLRQQLDRAHLAWVVAWQAQQLEFMLENVRFEHDARWRNRTFSLQAARDGGTWFWKAANVVVFWQTLSI